MKVLDDREPDDALYVAERRFMLNVIIVFVVKLVNSVRQLDA
jgi:hypothetical protein